jgi:hypothetical protein
MGGAKGLHVGDECGETWSEPQVDCGMVLCVDLFVGVGHIEDINFLDGQSMAL